MAISAKDILNPNKPDIIPITGGPNKNPKKPMLETSDNAVPVLSVFDLPVSLYTKGTTEDTPKPTSKKPIIAVSNMGNKIAILKPIVIKNPLS